MKTLLNAILSAALLAGSAASQAGGPPGPPPGGPHPHGAFGPEGFGPGMHSGKVVTGAPYTATATDTFTETLANGNTIQRTTTAIVARDSAGRTYEQRNIKGGPLAPGNAPATITFISDPVAGYSYVLNASMKTATRRPLHAHALGADGAEPPHNRPANPNIQETTLAPATINGMSVTGKTITHTIPAGEIGNAQPIVSTNTVWSSPDLQVVISATREDPRTGKSVYALTNIQRTEPPAAWFQIPSDYTVQDAKAWFGGPGRGEHPPQ